MLNKLLIPFNIVGITTKVTRENFNALSHVMQKHLFRHFSSPGHFGFLNNVSVTFIDKQTLHVLLKHENIWRETLMTMAPYGLNIEDSV